ncbi:hornerin-like [Helicoverpa zea]|uniref:hornerin-like n=1 Tax=Helicoverpa zea TaxID=7113 RepID=UPI001F56C6B9|nr:hornerin-like [Helicoverpa zea]
MATKFVVAVALLALCRANPVLINGVEYRDGRAYSIGQASSYGGGVSTAQANANGNVAQAFGSSSGGAGLARNGYVYPGQAIAQAQTYDAPPFPDTAAYGGAKAVAQAHNGAYYPVPAPAAVITYQQNFEVPAEVASLSSAQSNGDGIAQSSANTQGGIGNYVTSSNAKTQGSGSADSNARSGYGSTSTSAKTQGQGSAESSAQTNGAAGIVYPAVPAVQADEPAAVIDAKSPLFYTQYVATPVQGIASSNANVIGSGNAASSAKIGHAAGRTISWRFGTLYDSPASAQAQANTHSGYGAARSGANTHGYGSANANADVNGYGSAKSVADSHAAGGHAQSTANSHGAGVAKAAANVNAAGYGLARSDLQGQYYGGSRSSANAHTHGYGSAASSARTHGAALRVTNSQANSSGFGSAQANAVSVQPCPLSGRDLSIVNMATKFVVAVAMLALCRANPVLINGVEYRDGRAYSIGQASSYGGGVSTAQANANGNAAQAFGSSSGGAGLARNGYVYPGQAIAQAQTYDAPPFPDTAAYGGAKAVAQAHNGAYYPVPAPAAVITYQQNFEVPAEVASLSSAQSNGDGIAQSSANTQGGIGSYLTSSNAKTQGSGSADSNARSGYGSTSTSAKTQGQGSAESSAQTNGAAGIVYPAVPAVQADEHAAVIDAKSPLFYTQYVATPVQSIASSNANVIGSGNAASSAKIGHAAGRTISWRFGTLYDSPASAQAQANTHSGYGAARSGANTHGYGSANANADVNGYGSAKSVADSHAAGGHAQSTANSHGAGVAKAAANVNAAGYGLARSDLQGQYYGGSRSSANAHTHGYGSAASSARTHGAALRVTNSQANSSGFGSAQANAVSV